MDRDPQLFAESGKRGIERRRRAVSAERPRPEGGQPFPPPILEHVLVAYPLSPQIGRRDHPLLVDEAHRFL